MGISGSSTIHTVGAATFGSTVAASGSITTGGGLNLLSSGITNAGAITGITNFSSSGGLTVVDSADFGSSIASTGSISASSNVSAVGTITSIGNMASSGSITAGTSLIIGSADINETDFEKLDGITNGTAAANKAVVLDGSKNIATLGTVGCGAITSTGASTYGSLAGGALSGSSTSHVVGAATFGSTVDSSGSVSTDGSVHIKEKSDAESDTAAYGQLWVKTATPNQLYFTNDAGNDIQITSGGSLVAGTPTAISGTTAQLTTGVETSGFLKVTGSSTLGAVTATTYSGSSTMHTVGAATFGSTIDSSGSVTTDGSLHLKEKSDAESDTAAFGQLWVKTATPNQLYFTNDAGNDIQITSGGSLVAGTPTAISGTTAQLTTGVETSGFLKVTGSSTLGAITATTYSGSSTLEAVGNTILGGTLVVSGNIDTGGDMTAATITMTGFGVDADGDTILKSISGSGPLHMVGNSTFGGTLAASGSITAGSSFIIGSADINETDLEKLDGITNGTAAANKALVVDANKDIGVLGAVQLASVSGSSTIHMVGAATFGSTIDSSGSVSTDGSVHIKEKSDAESDTAAYGQLWVKTATPNQLYFTNDAGNDIQITSGGSLVAGTPTSISGTTAQLTTGVETSGYLKVSGSSTLNDVTTTTYSGSSHLQAVGNAIIGGTLTVSGNLDTSADMTAATITMTGFTVDADGDTTVKTISGSSNAHLVGTITSIGNIATSGSFVIGSADMNETDLEKLDGITNGTAAANKAVVLDGSKNIATLGTVGCGAITSTGDSSFANISGSGNSHMVGTISSTGNILTSGSFVIGSADMNETDLEKLDGITNGTAAANKAVVLDGSKNIGVLGDMQLATISGSGVIHMVGNATFGGTLETSGSITMAGATLTNALSSSAASHMVGAATFSSTIAATGSVGSATSIKTPLIEYTDGDDAITIGDGGTVTFSNTVKLVDDKTLTFGSNDDVTIEYDEDGTDSLLVSTDKRINTVFDMATAAPLTSPFGTDGNSSGLVIRHSPGADDTLNVGQIYFLHTDGTWNQADASAATTSKQMLGIGLGNARSVGVFLKGFIRIPSTEILNVPGSNASPGLPLYVSTTAGHIDFTAPSGDGEIVRIVGYAIQDSTDVLIYFDPDATYVEITA